jgi:hypothetical protein
MGFCAFLSKGSQKKHDKLEKVHVKNFIPKNEGEKREKTFPLVMHFPPLIFFNRVSAVSLHEELNTKKI